jgi:micrococcal nuclease
MDRGIKQHWLRHDWSKHDWSQWIKDLRMFWVVVILVFLLLFLLFGCQGSGSLDRDQVVERVKVTRVVSGQTLEVILPGKSTAEKVRLIGIDAPAWQQEPWFSQAKTELENWIGPHPITLTSDLQTTRQYADGSVIPLVYAWNGDQLLNTALVEAGLVLARVRSPNLKYADQLTYAQEKARILGRGLWNPDHPMRLTPTEFRSRQ